MKQDNITNLYNAISGKYDLGTENDFRNSLNDAQARKNLYMALRDSYDLGTEEDFNRSLGYGASSPVGGNNGGAATVTQQSGQSAGNVAPATRPNFISKTVDSLRTALNGTGNATADGQQAADASQQVPSKEDSRKAFYENRFIPSSVKKGVAEMVGDDPYVSEGERKALNDEIRTRLMARATPEQRREMLEHQYSEEANKAFDEALAEQNDAETIANNKKQVDKMRQEFVNAYIDEADKQYQPMLDEVREMEKQEKELRDAEKKDFLRENPQYDKTRYEDIEGTGSISQFRKNLRREQLRKEGLDNKIADANAELSSLKEMLENRNDGLDKPAVFSMNAPVEPIMADDGSVAEEYRASFAELGHADLNKEDLEAAIRQKRDQIRILEAERDDAGFVQGVADAAVDPSFWTMGLSDVATGLALGNIKNAIEDGKELTTSQKALLDATIGKQEAEEAYSRNRGFWYNAANVTVNAVPFVGEFMLTGGGYNAISMTGKAAGRLLGMQVKNKLAKYALRYTGTAIGDVASALTMATTTGGARTLADIEQRYLGQVEKTDDGYMFVDGEDWGEAITDGLVANTLEYYTEKLGGHLDFVGKGISRLAGRAGRKLGIDKGIEKLGLSKLSPVLTRIKGSDFFQQGNALLRKGGVHELPSEVLEEEANILLNAALVGDNQFSDLWDAKTQLDLVGGLAVSIGFMRALPIAGGVYKAGQYYRYKHATDVADTVANYRLTEEKWAPLKEQIDNATNEEFGGVLQSVIDNPSLEDQEKEAVADYAIKLLKMRGYNLGTIADAKDRIARANDAEPDETVADAANDGVERGYQEGYQTANAAARKQYAEEADAAAEQVRELFDEDEQMFIFDSNIPVASNVNHYLAHRSMYTDEQIIAAVDYYQKRARVEGMMDGAENAADLQVQQENAKVRSNTHQGTGQVITATRGGEQFYVVGGDIVTDPETGLDTLAGTGGAVVVKNTQTGEVKVLSPQELSIQFVQDAQQLIDYNENELRQQLMQQAENDMTYGEPANEVFMQDDEVQLKDADGNIIIGTIGMLPDTADGTFVVQTADGQALPYTEEELNRMVISHNGQEISHGLSQTATEEGMGNGLTRTNTEEELSTEQEQSGNLDNAGGEASVENGTGANNPSASAPSTPSADEVGTVEDSMPMIGEGEDAEPDFTKATSERAHRYIYNEAGLTREESDQFVDANKREADKALEKLTSKPPKMGASLAKYRKEKAEWQASIDAAQQRASYWQEVKDRQTAIVKAEQEAAFEEQQREAEGRRQLLEDQRTQREKMQTAKRIYGDYLDDDLETPHDATELVVLNMPRNLAWDDVKVGEHTKRGLQKELGLKRGFGKRSDTTAFNPYLAAKGKGIGIDDAVNAIYRSSMNELANGEKRFDDQEIKSALLDLLYYAQTPADIRDYVVNNRVAQAEAVRAAEDEAAKDAEMQAWAEHYHLTPEEREAFDEYIIRIGEEYSRLTDDEVREIMSIFAEANLINEEYEQSRRSEEVDSQPVERGADSESEGSQGEVRGQRADSEPGSPYRAGQGIEGAETATVEPSVPDNDVAGGTQGVIVPSEQLKPTDLRDAVRPESPEIGLNEANARASEAAEGEPQPIGIGDFGPIYDQFRGKPKEAIGFLSRQHSGEAIGALSHKDVGEIDLVWGEEGTGHSDGYGLAKLLKYHPEVLDDLQGILDEMTVTSRSDNRVNLESEKYKAAVRLTWNEKSKTWLLTVFEKKNSALDNTTDTGKTSERGKRNDTATPQSTVSEGKDTENISNEQEKSEKSAPAKPKKQHKRIVSDDQMEELRKKLLEKFNNLNAGIDVERMLLGAMYAVGKIERGVTKFADYAAEMVSEIGDAIRPYLKAFYEAVRNMPEAAEYRDQMTSPEEVAAFDEYNFDKEQKTPDPITKAEQVVKKQKAKQQVKKIEKEVKQKIQQGDLFAGDLFGEEAAVVQQQTEQPKPKEAKGKTAWWNDPNRPKNLDPKDYKTYTTDEAKEYFKNFVGPEDKNGKHFPDFTKWAHSDLAYITAAAWDGANIPVEELMKVPEIVDAEQRIRTKKGSLNINEAEQQQHVAHLLDDEHGSAVYENGKIKKVNGVPQFTGPVRQERKAFIVIGLPAGGKSSVFANPLSNENGARIIDSDVVKPWLSGYDEGYGAGYVQIASAKVADQAIMEAAKRGDNMVIPRIGGNSLIPQVVIPLREMGYDVQLFWNDVSEGSSIMRAASRFAEEGRYLSLGFLTKSERKDSKTFRNFAKKKLGDYYAERDEQETADSGHSVSPSGRVSDVLADRGGLASEGRTGSGAGSGVHQVVQGAGEREESERGGEEVPAGELIFSYAEWKSNDVGFGKKPKEIWNSKSGKPMPANDNNNEGEQKISGEPSSGGEGTEQASRPAERAGAERGSEQNRAERSGSGRSIEEVATESQHTKQPAKPKQELQKNKRNNQGERGKDYAPTSPKARFNANVEAIRLMRQLMDDGVEAPTKEQMEVLRKYSGWGGLGTYFNDESLSENKLLRELLTEEEYNDAVMSINSAYYTPAMVIDTLWDVAKAMGFKGGNVLEGSAGIGNIIGQMPQDMSRNSDINAVEIDTVSGNILRLLYPDATVYIQGFQDTVIPNGSVDLAITNVPFVTGLHVIDKVDRDLSRKFTNIHDFCIAKNIRKLREGGIGIFITSSGTMDKSNELRAWITDEGGADIVGAFRLNNETFGGTKVTSDIVVVRKRVGGKTDEHSIDASAASPLRVGTWTDKFGDDHQVTMVVNDYFKEHPEMMAGKMYFGYEKGETFRPGSYGLYPEAGMNQEQMLQDFAKEMEKAKSVATESQQTEQEPETNQLTAVKEGRMLVDDKERLCVSQRGVAVPLSLNEQKVKGYSKKQCFEDYQSVQKAVDDALQQQLNDPDDAALKPKLDALNKAFDTFVKRYGNLHKNTAIAFLRNDIDFPSFLALENYSETKDIKGKVTVITSKTPLFKQRVLGFKTEPQPKTVKDAVIASVFRSNGIDLEWIAKKLSEVAAPPNGDNWTADDVKKGILVSRLGFEDPSTGELVVRYKYLSGNVREKLAIAEAYNTDGKYSANIEELRKVVPMDIPAHLIDFSLGSSWIPVELYKDYLKENYDLDNVKLNHLEGSWMLDTGYSFRNEKNRSAGVYSEKFRETIFGHELVAAALNNRPVKVAKQVTEGYGSSKTTRTVVDQAATQACAVRVDEIKEEFKQWTKKKMQDDPELARSIEKIYNEKFNALVPMEIGDEFLPEHFDGSNVNISLYGHQKRGVMRGVTAPTMLAHEVGTGKSFTLISTAMEMRRLGTAKKPMIVVQNATVAQMTSDAKLLYPNAKVLSLSEKDRDAEGRRNFYAKIKYNDWDIIIVPQSTFERIPDSPERELQFIQEKIDEKKHVIEAAEQSGADSRELQKLKKELEKIEEEYGDKFLDSDPSNGGDSVATNGTGKRKKDAKREAAALDKAATRAAEQLDRAVDDVQYFDDLGVDALLVDEAHEYKHLGFQTSIGRGIKGIDPSYSKKCAGLYNKTRSVFEQAGWKNVVFATGTPISNTAAEIWTFMKYLMPPDVMKANDIYYFDDFIHNFGNIAQSLEFQTNGKFREVTRFSAYVNKPELIRIWSQVADTVLTKEVGKVQERIPDEEGGKDQDMFLPQSPSLVRIMAAVRAELERFENMTGQEKKENSSIPLTMYGIAKRAAIDPRLVDAEAPDEPMSKTNAAVKEIVADLKKTAEYKGTVAVFCDNQNRLGRNGDAAKSTVEFNIYEDMRDKLIKAGVPESQIAIIKSGMSITAKQKIFDAVNNGDIRVVLGSTQTLGTGVNMQERLHLLIHMDAPDRPMDYTQRNGRIKRQGNLHKQWGKTIRVIRFGVEDSLDVTAYQRLKTKSGFIDSIMDGKSALANNQVDRTVEEEEEGLFDNPVAVLSGSQYALKKNQAERELRKYQGKKAQWAADQVYVANALRRNAGLVASAEANIKKEEEQLEHIKSLFPDGKVKTITVEGVPVDMSSGGTAAYGELAKLVKEKISDPVNAIVKRNRENAIYNDETLKFTVELDGHPVYFTVQVARESVYENGKMRTVIHKYTSYSSQDLRSESMTSASWGVKDFLDEILEQVVTGQENKDRIAAYKASIERINAETKQLQQRVGMEFQYEKELEEAKKHVDEYTELMKQEMAEKEAKYAAQQKAADDAGTGGFDLRKAEDGEEEEELYRADEDEESIFYSNAMKAVESIKQEKATPEQWLAMITKAGGLKAGEDKWLGLSDWLKEQKGSITKREVMDFIRENQIRVEEVPYGGTERAAQDKDYESLSVESLPEAMREPMRKLNERWKALYQEARKDADSPMQARNAAFVQLREEYGRDFATYFASRSADQLVVRNPFYLKEAAKMLGVEADIDNPINPTRLKYTTEGLRNKREIALVVPTVEPWNKGDDIHFGDAGDGRAVAWIRFGETTDKDGKKVLVIDEIQSKRHQEGREKGYSKYSFEDEVNARNAFNEERARLCEKYGIPLNPQKESIGKIGRLATEEEKSNLEGLYERWSEITEENSKDTIPDAPFDKNWHELAMKRMLRYAAENGYDKVAWTKGEQQAKRYDIGKVVDKIISYDYPATADPDGRKSRKVEVRLKNGETMTMRVDQNGKVIEGRSDTEGKMLSDIVGKDLAKSIMSGEGKDGTMWDANRDLPAKIIEGDGLRIGGEGMKGFYDQMLPRFMDKYGKKWGAKTGEVELPNVEEAGRKMWSVDVTPEMKESVMQGQPMFRDMETFEEGDAFPIHITYGYGKDVLSRNKTYSIDLLVDEFGSVESLLDALRVAYPGYFIQIVDGKATFESWDAVMKETRAARTAKQVRGTESFFERKTRNAINAVKDLAGRMGLDVDVLTSTEGLEGKKARAKGFFNPKTGKITIVLPNHTNQSDLVKTLLHEGVAHYGLRKMFGEHFDTFLDNIYNNVDAQVRARIDAAMKRNGWSRHVATEEYLARLAEQTSFENALTSGWWQKIKDFFLRMLAEVGLVMREPLTDNELRYILWRSYENLLHPDKRRNIFDKAREVDMQSRLGVRREVLADASVQGRAAAKPPQTEPAAEVVSMYSPMVQTHNELKEKYPGALFIFKMPDGNYRAVGDSVEAVGSAFGRGAWGNDVNGNEYNIPKDRIDLVLPRLIRQGYRIAIVDAPKEGVAREGDDVSWYGGELLNSDIKNIPSQELLLTLQEKEGDERNETINELVRRFREGEARIVRMGQEMELDRCNDAEIAGAIVGGWELGLSSLADGTLRGVVQGRSEMVQRPGAQGSHSDSVREIPIISWAKSTGHYYDEDEVKRSSLDKKVWLSGAQSNVYRTADGKKVIKFMESWVYYQNPLLKHIDGIVLQNNAGFDHSTVLGYSLDEKGRLLIVLEQDYVDGVTIDDVFEDDGPARVNSYIDNYLEKVLGLEKEGRDDDGNPLHKKDGLIYKDIHGANVLMDRSGKLHIIDGLVEREGDSGKERGEGFSIEDEEELFRADEDERDDIHTISETINEYNRSLMKPDEKANWLQQLMRREWRKYNGGRLREAWQDSMLALKRGQDIIVKHSGTPLKDYEDAYSLENLSHGRGKNEYEWFDRNLYKPMLKAFWRLQKALGVKEEDVHKYLFCKHGLERNVEMAFRDAVSKEVTAAQKKYQKELKEWEEESKVATQSQQTLPPKPEEPKGVLEIHKEYREDPERIANEEAWKDGSIDYQTYRAVDDEIRKKYAPDYPKFRKRDYAGLTGLFATEHEESDGTKVTDYPSIEDAEKSALAKVDAVENRQLLRHSRNARNVTAKELCDDLWKRINACTKWTLLKSYQSGQMNKAVYEYVKGMYEHYIPLRGWDGTNAQDVYDYVGSRAGVFSNNTIPAKGRTSVADNPIAYIGNMAMSGIVIGQKQMVKQRLLNLARNHKTDLLGVQGAWYQNMGTDEEPLWQAVTPDIPEDATAQEVADIVDDFERRMEALKKEGRATQDRAQLNIVYPAPSSQLKEHEIHVTENGKEYIIYVNGDPRLAQAVNGTRARKSQEGHTGFINELAAKSGRFKAAIYTSFSPAFIVTNWTRDISMAIASSLISKGIVYNARAARNTAALLNPLNKNNIFHLMWLYTHDKLDMRSSTQRMFKEFMAEGAETGFIAQLDLESFKKGINKELGKQNQVIVNPKRIFRGYLQTTEFLNRCIEDSTRFIVYKTSREKGQSAMKAASEAKNVTLNFNRKGTGEFGNAFARGAFIFVNPAIQGIQTLFRLAKGHPFKFTAVTAGWVLGGALMPYINAMLMQLFGPGDDGDEEAYWKLPEHVRRQCLCVYVGDGDFITIPLAQEFRTFWGIGEQAAARMMGHGKEDLKDEGLDIVESFLDLLPMDLMGHGVRDAKWLSHDWWVGMRLNFAPDIIKTELESLHNRDFTGKPVYRSNEWNKHLPEWTKSFKGTPEWLTRSAQLLNTLTGGEGSWKAGWADVNPSVLDHELRGWVGGPFNFGSGVLSTAAKLFNGEDVKVYDVPVLNRLLNSPSERETKDGLPQSYWKMYAEEWKPLEQTVSEMKKQAKAGSWQALDALEQFYLSDEYSRYADMKAQVDAAKLQRESQASGDSFEASEAQRQDTPESRYNALRNGKDAFEDWCVDEIGEQTLKYKKELDAMVSQHRGQEVSDYRAEHSLELEARSVIERSRARWNQYKRFLGHNDAMDEQMMKKIRSERDELLRVYRFDDIFKDK